MTKNYNTILLDLDGTIINPTKGILNSIDYALTKLDIKEDNFDKLIKYMGTPIIKIFKNNYNLENSKLDLALEKYNEYFSVQGMFESETYENITNLLDILTKTSKKLIAVTLKPTVYTVEILKKLEIDEFFYFISGTDLDINNINKSRIISKSLEELGDEAEKDIIMVGDRSSDIVAAKDNNIDSVGVLYGYGKKENLESESPTFLANNIDDLKEILM
jgi:phosphoglycolate phosphatase